MKEYEKNHILAVLSPTLLGNKSGNSLSCGDGDYPCE